MGYIYIHTCPNGKKYIGQTRKSRPQDRWGYGGGYKGQKYFYSAIMKYGWNNIAHEYFEVCNSLLDFMEIHYISMYKTADRHYGYNLESGGHKNKVVAEETRLFLSTINNGGAIECYTKEGELIHTFSTKCEAKKWLRENGWEVAKLAGINKCLKGQANSAYGYVWKMKK